MVKLVKLEGVGAVDFRTGSISFTNKGRVIRVELLVDSQGVRMTKLASMGASRVSKLCFYIVCLEVDSIGGVICLGGFVLRYIPERP